MIPSSLFLVPPSFTVTLLCASLVWMQFPTVVLSCRISSEIFSSCFTERADSIEHQLIAGSLIPAFCYAQSIFSAQVSKWILRAQFLNQWLILSIQLKLWFTTHFWHLTSLLFFVVVVACFLPLQSHLSKCSSMRFKQISILLSIPVIMYTLFCFLGTSKRWLKKKKKRCVFLASYFLATMNLSSIYLSLGQIQQQKISESL